MREICLDIETTGLNPQEGHRIVEIACVELFNKIKTGQTFHTYVNPRRDMPMEAYAIHGISSEFLQDKPIFDHIASKFLDFIKDTPIIIHNAPFDTKFLNFELKSLGMKTLNMSLVIDTLVMARAKFPGSPNSLDALCKRFNISLNKRDKHGALVDTDLLADVYIEMTGGIQRGFGFDAEVATTASSSVKADVAKKNIDVSVQNLSENIVKNTKPVIAARPYVVSEEELELHRDFIAKNIKNSLWN